MYDFWGFSTLEKKVICDLRSWLIEKHVIMIFDYGEDISLTLYDKVTKLKLQPKVFYEK